jgi:succinate dehydrogenase/fumarate reductase flavoprotein subunit
LIEKGPEVGGTTAISSGLIWTFADFERVRSDIPDGDAALQWMVYDTIDDARTWLAAHGAELGPDEPMLGYGRGRSMNPPQAVAALTDRFQRLGGTLQLETALESLVERDGDVCGVRVSRDGRVWEEAAGAVVLATGGFQGNPELLARYVLPNPGNVYLRANPWSTGDAFIAAMQIGAAASAGLDTFYGHALTAPPARFSKLEFRDVTQYYGQAAVALNMRGKRFADETEGNGEEVLNQRLVHQPGGRGFYIIDQDVLVSMPMQGLEIVTETIIARARAAGAPVVQADTLEDLCRGLARSGMPEQQALRTLQEFNALTAAGRAAELEPARRARQKPLAAPPYYAVPVKGAITFTMGGLRTDERARVLRRSGSTSPVAATPVERAFADLAAGSIAIGADYRQMPIKGLFAAGCDVGNISNFEYMGGLATALATGCTAGREAARFITM